ncbi:SAM-dependent methyltransferase [Streptomyces sp. NBC_01275]|uniref:SAM-dependent methyltransferase n=1 Tax=Streptomyces sp. NBC_01275 TaxID=2903807 RepID=UPI002254B0FB|nr:SAM-dependent methyltransferase [Streptomyces sp. NBC_01275]MCX4765272.1 SAM-dependent methyltransferase [Streptomyces sp. NBC_01275]
MTPVLVRQHLPHAGPTLHVDRGARARDWSEIQERMLVPLYEAVYERLEVGPGTRLLGLGCGAGLALLMAATRGAALTGVEPSCPERLALARERLLPETHERLLPETGSARTRDGAKGGGGNSGGNSGANSSKSIRLIDGSPEDAADAETPAYTLVTAFEPVGCRAGDADRLLGLLAEATPLAERGAPVVLAGWGPPERCATASVLRVATRPPLRDDLEEIARRAGLKPDGSGRVACPFGYAGVDSAVKGLLSTGLFDTAIAATDQEQVDKELTEALHPYQRRDGAVWMPNVFRYLIARTP